MHLSKNIQKQEQIIFIIKKTKLILKEYQKIFTDYQVRMRKKDNALVSEQIIKTMQQSVKGICVYLFVMEQLELEVFTPRIFINQIDKIKGILDEKKANIE